MRAIALAAMLLTGCLAPADGAVAQDLRCEGEGDVCSIASGEAGVCIDGTCQPGMLVVAAGDFTMGCAEEDDACYASELPRITVSLSEFAIDRTEVTLAAYRDCVAAKSCTAPAGRDELWSTWNAVSEELPVDNVSWSQAKHFCAWRSRRLCSEAEWEYAARGPSSRVFPWGEGNLCEWAVLTVETETACGEFAPAPVGSKAKGQSEFGAMDMAGNVAEWVADCWHADLTGTFRDGAARKGCDDQGNVVKGGDLTTTWRGARSSYREARGAALVELRGVGIRCCKMVGP